MDQHRVSSRPSRTTGRLDRARRALLIALAIGVWTAPAVAGLSRDRENRGPCILPANLNRDGATETARRALRGWLG